MLVFFTRCTTTENLFFFLFFYRATPYHWLESETFSLLFLIMYIITILVLGEMSAPFSDVMLDY